MVKLHKKKKLYLADWLILAVFVLLMLITVVPFMNLLAISLSDNAAILSNTNMLIPKNFTLQAYGLLLDSPAVIKSFFMTIAITLTATVLHLAVTILAATALSRKNLPGRKGMMLFTLFTMLFSGGLIPTYMLISRMGLIDTFAVMTVPGVVSAYSIFLMKNFILQIPSSLQESAEIDGAGPVRVLWNIILPLSLPIIATLALFCSVGKWNDWTTAFIYVKVNKDLYPIQNFVQSLAVFNEPEKLGSGVNYQNFSEAFQKALTIFAILPVVIVYPFVQKYFVKGIYMGSVKE